MSGKTHVAAGMASSLTIMSLAQLDDSAKMVTGLTVAAFAAVLPDIDIPTSKYGKRCTMVAYGGLASILLLLLFYKLNNPLALRLLKFNSNVNSTYKLIGLLMLFVLTVIGNTRPHREFTHSILALLLFSFAFYLVLPEYVLWFSVSYCSHIVLDLLNKKKVSILWPIKNFRVCFNICYADGVASVLISILCTLTVIIESIFIIF